MPALEEKCDYYKLLPNFEFCDTSSCRSVLICPCGFLDLGMACETKYVMLFADFQKLFMFILSYSIRATHHIVFPFKGFT